MAYPNVFEIEEPATGKKYRVEGVEGTTREEAIEYLSSLPDEEIVKREILPQPQPSVSVEAGASSVPTVQAQAPAQQAVEEYIAPGVNTQGDPFRFPDEVAAELASFAANPGTTFEDYNALVNTRLSEFNQPALGVADTPENREMLKSYQQAPEDQRVGIGYTPWVEQVPLNEMGSSFTGDDWLSQVGRSIEDAWTDPASGVSAIGRTISDWADVGGDVIDRLYPDLTPEQREQMQEEFIGFVNRKMSEGTQAGVAEDDLAPWLLGQFVAPDPIDILPISRAAKAGTVAGRIAEKGAEGAVTGGIADAAYQGLAISDQAQDEFDPTRVATNAALGGALHSTIQGIAEPLARTSSRDRVRVPDGDAAARYNERVTTNIGDKKATPKVRREAAARAVADHIDDVKDGWQNAPTFEVHQNFKKLNADDDALGYIDEDGVVRVNLEAVLDEAKIKGISPAEVVTSLTYHEALGHHGLTQRFGDGLDTILTRWYEESPEFSVKVNDWLKANPDAYKDHPNRTARAADEVLAEMSEAGPLPASVINRFKNYIKGLARKMGMKIEFTNREIETILGQAHKGVIKGSRADVSGEARYSMSAVPPREVIDKYKRDYGLDEMQAVNRARAEAFKNSSRSELAKPDTSELDQYVEERVWDRRVQQAVTEYNRRSTDVQTPEVDPLEQVPLTPEDGVPTPEVFGYDNIKALDLMARAEDNPGKIQTERMWPNNENIVDFRYVDPNTREEVYGAFEQDGDTAKGFEVYGSGRNALGPKTVQEVRRQLKQLFPEIKRLEGVRISGARNKGTEVRYQEGTPVSIRFMKKKSKEIEDLANKAAYSSDLHTKKLGEMYWMSRKVMDNPEVARDANFPMLRAQMRISKAGFFNEPENLKLIDAIIENMDYVLGRSKDFNPSNDNTRYMKKKSKEVSTDDIFESENAIDILRAVTSDYQPVVFSMDDFRSEAEMRGHSPERLLKNKALDLGELPRRFIMQDIAADKLNEKVAGLYHKIQSGQGTYKDRVAHSQALLKYKELVHRIFDEQGEAGRLLRTIQELDYTRKKVSGVLDTLEGIDSERLTELLNDPEEYMRFAKAIQDQADADAEAKQKSKLSEKIANVINIPRAIMSSGDLSAPFRQGLFLVGRPEFWKTLPSMLKYLASDGAYNNLMLDISRRNTYPLMVQNGLALTSTTGKLSRREEAFQSSIAQKLPWVKATERAFNGFLNKLRADTFDSLLKEADDLGVKTTPKFFKDLAGFVNNATGRGDLGTMINSASPLLSTILFSPRLIASRAQLLNPVYYARLDPFVRKQAITSLLSATGFVSTVLGLGALAGADTELDPRSSDFGKLKFGNTRYDIPGGFAQYIVLGTRLSAALYNGFIPEEDEVNEYKNAMGEPKKYGNKFGQRTAWNALEDFLYNKWAPIPSYVHEAGEGTTATGDPFNPVTGAGSRFVPMFMQDAYEVMEERGLAEGALMASPSILGVGVQNYTPSAADPEKEVLAPDSFEMQELEDGENDLISVSDGVVTLKGEAKEEWQRRINVYVREWMKDEMADPNWEKLTLQEKADVIKSVRDDARKQTKQDMLPLLGIE